MSITCRTCNFFVRNRRREQALEAPEGLQETTMKISKLNLVLAVGATALTMSVGGAYAATMVDNAVDIMSGPGANYHTIGKLQDNDNVSVVRTSGEWCRISAPTTG